MIKHGIPYWFWDGELPDKLCDLIIEFGNSENLKQAEVGDEGEGKLDHDVRKSKVSFLGINWLNGMLWSYMSRANISAGWNFVITEGQDPQFTIYDTSDFYGFHADDGGHENNMRKLSLSIFLSDPSTYTGGKFEFENADPPEINKRGSVLVFPSFLRHRVTKLESGTRYSLVNWFIGPAFV